MSGARERPDSPNAQATLCPYCGHLSSHPRRCRVCSGLFDPLSRQATQNTMGPWYVRDESQPFLPGRSYETMCRLVGRGKITRATIVRGPTTMQFWVVATRAPGIAHLLGECHSCHARVQAQEKACAVCGARFGVDGDRQRLGLAPVHLLPGQASPEQIALQSQAEPGPAVKEPDATTPVQARPSVAPAPEPVGGDVTGEEGASRRRVKLGKVAFGLLLVLLGGAGIWLGVQRGVFEVPVAGGGAAQVVGGQAAEATPDVGRAPDQEAPQASAPGAAKPAGVVALLRVGDIEAAADASSADGDEALRATIEERLERDRILGLLGG